MASSTKSKLYRITSEDFSSRRIVGDVNDTFNYHEVFNIPRQATNVIGVYLNGVFYNDIFEFDYYNKTVSIRGIVFQAVDEITVYYTFDERTETNEYWTMDASIILLTHNTNPESCIMLLASNTMEKVDEVCGVLVNGILYSNFIYTREQSKITMVNFDIFESDTVVLFVRHNISTSTANNN